ncbi:MAG: 1-deoxy-D-xylulose-5-phosphate synthase [Gammaproteobacteria bacterium]|nr:1-deoxy-D-xylulose-5-phosphate synthase [Gammaproteobacteria bacterium]
MSLLDQVTFPNDLKGFTDEQLLQLSHELRQFLFEELNISGGHFGANLGTVELALALHAVFDTPHDRIVWDVGHQAYVHKILTGRKNRLKTIRQQGGLSGFPLRTESIYDAFGVGHSSTSISAALGMACGSKLKDESRHVVAVIGDGALTAGMAYEALNHAGDLKSNLLVILNDNDMSISHNVGAMSNYLTRLLSSKFYTGIRKGSKKVLEKIPPMLELARRTEEHMKGMVGPGTLFEELGFNYLGPIDGHDLPTLLATLRNVREMDGPQLLHVVTVKGKGLPEAEADQIKYHFVNPGYLDQIRNPSLATQQVKKSAPATFSQVFGEWLCAMAEKESSLVGITPAMCEGSGMVEFSQKFPQRYFDVAIAEQHAVTLAAGMACEGLKPVVAIYSTFLQRAYDQLIHDVAIQDLPVLFAIDRSGLVGADGATHMGNFDLSYLRCIPNIVVMTPADENECWHLLNTGFYHQGPAAVRYPRGAGMGTAVEKDFEVYPIGKGVIKRQGQSVAILNFGTLLPNALAAAEKLDATVADMRFVKPLDHDLIAELVATHHTLVTLEDNAVMGGAGSAVNEYLIASGKLPRRVVNLGIPDKVIEQATQAQQYALAGLDVESIIKAVKD